MTDPIAKALVRLRYSVYLNPGVRCDPDSHVPVELTSDAEISRELAALIRAVKAIEEATLCPRSHNPEEDCWCEEIDALHSTTQALCAAINGRKV